MTTYKLTCWSDEWEVEANLVEASAPVYVDGDSTPFQTADFRHREEVMRVKLAQYLYAETPDHDADFASVATLEKME